MKFAVIGCGHIGKRHIEILSSGEPFELAAVCDTDATAKPAANVPFYNSIPELISSGTEFEAATIATPNGLHEEHAIELLRAGKHVLIEKPMALSGQACQRILNVAKQHGKQVFCVLQLKFAPVALWLKQLVQDGTLGQLYLAQVNCFWNRDGRYYKKGSWHGTKSLDGGLLFTQFSHYIDLLYWLFGDVQNISSRLSVYRHRQLVEFEDSGLVSFEFANGGMGGLNFSTAVADTNLETSLTLISEKGTVKISGQYLNNVEYCLVQGKQIDNWPRTAYSAADNHRLFFENVVSMLNEGNGGANAVEAMKVIEIIGRIYASNIH